MGAQYESEMVYHSLREEWEKQGVIFDSIEDGLKNHPELLFSGPGMGLRRLVAHFSFGWTGGMPR